jgi:hypothetical protein
MTMTTHKIILAALVASLGCASDDAGPGPDDPGNPIAPPPTAPPPTTGNEDTTFDHDNTAAVDPFELLAQMEEEGPPEFSARLHSCPKIKYGTIGRLLSSRGVDVTNGTELSAGQIYQDADQALGVANYAARIPETSELTTASAAKMFDIFVAAAPEIIANMESRPECTVAGIGTRMFNDAGQCTPDGITCLIGYPATPGHLELCNHIIGNASTPDQGRIIAVASLAAAAHTCE